MKTLFIFLFLLIAFSVHAQSNQTNVLQTKRIWEDGKEYPVYTSFYIFPNQPWPKCGEFNVVRIRKEYAENVKWIKDKYPNAKFREVVIRFQPASHEIELTFEKFQEIICK